MTKLELAHRELKLLLVPLVIVLLPVLMIFGLPYGFYVILRFVVFFVLGYLALQHWKLNQVESVWLLGPIAILFNPFFPFALGGPVWIIVDIFTAGILWVRRRRIAREIAQGTLQP